MKKIITIIFGISLLFIPISKANAKTLQEYYDELEKLEEKKKQVEEGKKLNESELAKINSEIIVINNNITKTEQEIKEKEKEVELSEDKIKEKKEETNEYLLFLQLSNSGNTYLEYLFDADDYTDLIYRYAIVSQMSEYNTNLISELETLINDLENKKQELSEKEKNLATQRKEYAEKANTLRANITEQTSAGSSLEDDIKGMKAEIAGYVAQGCKRTDDVGNCKKVTASKGWQLPLKSGRVSQEYNRNTGHYALDLAQNEGTPVYPAAAGTVVKILDKYHCGGNMIYINHIVNGKKYTTVYMHLLEYYVQKDQEVTENTVLGLVGGYTTSATTWCPENFIGRGGYDECTCGAHLHFGMADGWSQNSFNVNSFDPRDIFKLPSLYVWFTR